MSLTKSIRFVFAGVPDPARTAASEAEGGGAGGHHRVRNGQQGSNISFADGGGVVESHAFFS